MYQLILIIHIFAAASIIGLVLVQQGKGAAIGSAFGSGASQTVFGSRGSGSFLLKVTIGLVVVFFATSIGLNYLTSAAFKQEKVVILPPATSTVQQPAVTPSSIPTGSAAAPVTRPVEKK